MVSPRDGYEAERLFAKALERLGYRRVKKIDPLVPHTFRVATQHEDRGGVDFLLTPSQDSLGRARPVVPLQFSIGVKTGILGRKRAQHNAGLIAFWGSGSGLGRGEELFEALQRIALGNREVLQGLALSLDVTINDFLVRRKNRTENHSVAPLVSAWNSIRLGKHGMKEARRLLPSMPQELQVSIGEVIHGGGHGRISRIIALIAHEIVRVLAPISPKIRGFLGARRFEDAWGRFHSKGFFSTLPKDLRPQVAAVEESGLSKKKRMAAIQQCMREYFFELTSISVAA